MSASIRLVLILPGFTNLGPVGAVSEVAWTGHGTASNFPPVTGMLFPRIRQNRDLRSAMMALCALFLLAGLASAFAGGAGAVAPDGAVAAIHCLDGAIDDDAGQAPLSCCSLACPMVGFALAGPLPAAVEVPRLAAAIAGLIIFGLFLTGRSDYRRFARGPPSRF